MTTTTATTPDLAAAANEAGRILDVIRRQLQATPANLSIEVRGFEIDAHALRYDERHRWDEQFAARVSAEDIDWGADGFPHDEVAQAAASFSEQTAGLVDASEEARDLLSLTSTKVYAVAHPGPGVDVSGGPRSTVDEAISDVLRARDLASDAVAEVSDPAADALRAQFGQLVTALRWLRTAANAAA